MVRFDSKKQTPKTQGLYVVFGVLLLIIIGFAVYKYQKTKAITDGESSATNIASEATSESATAEGVSAASGQEVILSGTIKQVDGANLVVNDGVSDWQFVLKGSAKVRLIAVVDGKSTTTDVAQDSIRKGQKVLVRFYPSIQQSIDVNSIDTMN